MTKTYLYSGPKKDITGQQFKNLLVMSMQITNHSYNREYRAICKCLLCGKEGIDIKPSWLKDPKHYGNCGCDKSHYKDRTKSNSVSWKGCGEMNSYFLSNAKRRAISLKLDCDLDTDFLWNLFIKQNRKCALTGLDLKFASGGRRRSDGTASLDRIDSSIGYIKSNVQWVHKDINLMKLDFDLSYFIEMCNLVSKNFLDRRDGH